MFSVPGFLAVEELDFEASAPRAPVDREDAHALGRREFTQAANPLTTDVQLLRQGARFVLGRRHHGRSVADLSQ